MRIKRFDISTRFLKDIFSGKWIHWRVVENALPEDAEIIGIVPSNPLDGGVVDMLKIYVFSPSFPDLIENQVVETYKMLFMTAEGPEHIAGLVEEWANRYVSIDSKLHHPDPAARLYAALREVDAEIMKRMAKLNEDQK